jgi:hypothetical protein
MMRFFNEITTPEQEMRKVTSEIETHLAKACSLKNSDENRACYQLVTEFHSVVKAPQATAQKMHAEEVQLKLEGGYCPPSFGA